MLGADLGGPEVRGVSRGLCTALLKGDSFDVPPCAIKPCLWFGALGDTTAYQIGDQHKRTTATSGCLKAVWLELFGATTWH